MSLLQKFLLKFTVLAALLLGLPLAGVFFAGFPLEPYLEFPPPDPLCSARPVFLACLYGFCHYNPGKCSPAGGQRNSVVSEILTPGRNSRRIPFPLVGLAGCNHRFNFLDARLDPFTLVYGFSAAHLQPSLVFIHTGCQCTVHA